MKDAHNDISCQTPVTTHPGIGLSAFAGFLADPDGVLSLLEAATGFTLNPLQRVIATEVGGLIAAESVPTASALVTAWGDHRDLDDFANAVRSALHLSCESQPE